MKYLLKLNNQQLLKTFSVMVQKEKTVLSELILHLSEIGRRRLYLREGYSSLYNYLIKKYHYSKSAAHRRIQAAKLTQRCPQTIGYLKAGKLNLTTISLIEPHVTQKNKQDLVEKILGKSKEAVEDLLLTYAPKPEKHFDKIRRLPPVKVIKEEAQKASNSSAAEPVGYADPVSTTEKVQKVSTGPFCPTPIKKELTIRRVKIEFVADEKVAKQLERAREILRHKYPHGKLEDIIHLALSDLLEKRDPCRKIFRRKSAQSHNNKKAQKRIGKANLDSSSRYIPAAIRRQIWKRDNGQCHYRSLNGKLCGEKNFLQIDHVKPFALGGHTTEDNLRLLCFQHNQWRTEKMFL